MLAHLIIAASLATGPITDEVDTGDVIVRTSIQGQVFQWEVTNRELGPIVGFRIPQTVMYNERPPVGWSMERSEDGLFYVAWTDDPAYAIRLRRRLVFEATASTQGSVLGLVAAELTVLNETSPVVIDGIRAPVRPPKLSIAIVPILLAIIGLLHAALTRRQFTTP